LALGFAARLMQIQHFTHLKKILTQYCMGDL
jgi:hypothetical protein